MRISDWSSDVCSSDLCEEAVDVVDVLGPLDLRDHDPVELVADRRHQAHEVVEHPGRVEGVDSGPQLGVAEVGPGGEAHEALAGGLLSQAQRRGGDESATTGNTRRSASNKKNTN